MKHIDLEQFAGGKLSVQLNKALEKITENVQDPNTDAQKVRKINVSISFRPNDERNFVATTVETKLSLAPELGATTALSMGRDLRTGEVEAVEILNQIPGQMNVDDVIDQEEDETPKAFDPDTGEYRRFDPDCAIAQSWQRLMIGKDVKPHDRTLIEHELLEMKIKRENPDMEHWKAHQIASEKYDYPKEAIEYYGIETTSQKWPVVFLYPFLRKRGYET